jgi:hypothetical protein
METWLAMLLIVTLLVLLVWYLRRKDRRGERAEFEAPEDIFDAPAVRVVGGGGRGSRSADQDRNEGDAGDGGGDGGGGD